MRPFLRVARPPQFEPIQSVPSFSSASDMITLWERPSRVVKVVTRRCFTRFNPPPTVPTHKLPSRSRTGTHGIIGEAFLGCQ